MVWGQINCKSIDNTKQDETKEDAMKLYITQVKIGNSLFSI